MGIKVGDVAPDFTLVDVTTGEPVSLSDYQGQVVALSFAGASWCGPCKYEIPVLQDLWEDIGLQPCTPPVQFLMVGFLETDQSLKNAAKYFGLSFPALFDQGGAVAGQYGVTGVPDLFIVGKDGKVCKILYGAGGTAETMYDEIHQALLDCGACAHKTPGEVINVSSWAAVMTILFGVVQDGGGLGISPSGKPIPIDPWGPLARMSPAKQNVLANLAISEMSKLMRDRKAAQAVNAAAMRSAEASMKILASRAARKSAAPDGRLGITLAAGKS